VCKLCCLLKSGVEGVKRGLQHIDKQMKSPASKMQINSLRTDVFLEKFRKCIPGNG
jgi:hypothetical protein